MEWRFVLWGDTIPARPAELRPIPCTQCQWRQQGKRSGYPKKYSAIHIQGEAHESDVSSRDRETKFIHRFLQVRIPRANLLRKSFRSH
jgi:hypothetical protein